MSKNNFVSHFLPFQINTTIFIFVNFFTKWLPAAILDVRKSLSIAFLAISDQYATSIFFKFFFVNYFYKKWRPFWMSENHFRITFLAILDQYRFLFFLQNGCQWPFWMFENHFRSHFWPFQIKIHFGCNFRSHFGHFGNF